MKLAQFKLIAFDLDGTLYPTGAEVGRAVLTAHAEYVRSRGMDVPTPTMDWVYKMIGADAKEFYAAMMPDQPREVQQDFEDFCLEYERKAVADHPHLFDGAIELLDALKHAGKLLVIVSNGGPTYVGNVWESTGLGKWFSGCYPYGPPEFATKGERLRLVIEDFGEQPVMIGDRRSDLEAAEFAGVPFIGCGYGYAQDGELTGAPVVVDHISALYNLLINGEEQK